MKPQRSDDALAKAREALAKIDRRDAEQEIRHQELSKPAKTIIEGILGASVQEKIDRARQTSKIFNTAAKALETAMHYTGPVGRAVMTIGGFLKSAFKYAAFEREGGTFKRDADGDLIFSPTRLGRSFLLAAMIGTSSIVGGQYAYFHATKFEQTIYTTGKDAIITGEKYEFTGCNSLPCSTESDNGEFFHITQSLYAPRLLYPENDVYSIIPKNDGVCHIKGYGLYIKELKFLHKYFEFYPNVYDAVCRPYTQAEKDIALESGHIVGSPPLPNGTQHQQFIPPAPQ